jgi:hypothetical protein
LARYVFGDELKLKPGKRWKRRLLHAMNRRYGGSADWSPHR